MVRLSELEAAGETSDEIADDVMDGLFKTPETSWSILAGGPRAGSRLHLD